MINKIRKNQLRFVEDKNNLQNSKNENEELNKITKELYIKRKNDEKKAIQLHKERILSKRLNFS